MEKSATHSKKTYSLVAMSLCVAILVVCSWITVPFTIPFSLQTLAVPLIVMLIGGKRGLIVTLCYILLGAVGLPVFSGFQGGIYVLLGPTGGYILGFILWAVSFIIFEKITANKQLKTISYILINVFCLVIVYVFGTLWFVFGWQEADSGMNIATAITICVLPYVIPDIVKICVAVFLSKRLTKAHISFWRAR